MVGVNKPIRKTGDSAQNAPKRRPRNTELNSSRKTVSGVSHTASQNPFKAKLNCSRQLDCNITGKIDSDVYDKLYSRVDDPEKIADTLGMTVEDVLAVDRETEENGYGKTVGYLIAKPEYEEELSQNGIDVLSILEDGTVGMMVGRGFHTVETDLEDTLDRINDSSDLDGSCNDKTDVNSELDGKTEFSGKVTIYNDFADLDNDTTERLLRSRVEKAVPGAKVDFEKVNDTDVKVKIDCPDADAEKARLAVESSDVTKSVDWESATEELDSSKKLNSSRWDWNAWDDYAEQIPASPQITEAVARYADGDDIEIEKVLQPTGAMREYLNQVGIDALIFVYDPTDREGYEEILGWTGSGIDDNSAFNLADIQDRAVAAGFDIDSSKKLNCSTDEETNLDDIKITTESGNEVSMQDIKIVQNPDTNELAIFIPEDEEDTIPEGFSVIGMVVPDMVDSVPAIEGSEVCPECGQDPCVCEDDDLDSSKKKNSR